MNTNICFLGNNTFQRYLSLLGACLCTSSAGVIYAFSLFSPQLSKNLNLPSSKINFIGASGHFGLFGGSLLFGYLSAKTNNSKLLFSSSLFFILGFTALAGLYVGQSTNYLLYSLFYLFVGLGSSIATIIPLSITSYNFSGYQGFAIGLPLVFFSLSGMVYSFVYKHYFVKSTGIIDLKNFLDFLGYATFTLTFMSLFILKKVEDNSYNEVVAAFDEIEQQGLLRRRPTAVESIKGIEFLRKGKTQLLFVSLLGIAGTGLMYSNNVGELIHVLDAKTKSKNDLPHLQSVNVAIFSISNTLGRLFVTVTSDLMKNKHKISRIYYIIVSCLLMAISQILVILDLFNINSLYICSLMVGFSYGSLFATSPTLISEWFSSENFSYNWGLMSIAPALGSEFFNFIFGYVYDIHSKTKHNGSLTCKQGLDCYFYSFMNTSIVCGLCFFISLYIRDPKHT